MRYTGTIYKGVIISKGINHTDFIDENEIELTKEQYFSIKTPCKFADRKFIPCEFPETETDGTLETPVSEMEQLRADVDYIAVMMGVEL